MLGSPKHNTVSKKHTLKVTFSHPDLSFYRKAVTWGVPVIEENPPVSVPRVSAEYGGVTELKLTMAEPQVFVVLTPANTMLRVCLMFLILTGTF